MKIEVEFDEETTTALEELVDNLGISRRSTLLEVLRKADQRLWRLRAERNEANEHAAGEGRRANAAEALLAEAFPIIHAAHGGQPPLVDFTLCVHPDCTRFHP